MRGKPNLFQAAMLRWRTLHPYNAVHVIHVSQPLDPVCLEATLRAQLEASGLTGLELDARARRYEWRGGPASIAVRATEGGGDVTIALGREIERELNAGFAAGGRIEPFRFFTVADATGFYLGLAYDHWVGGGDSIAALLRRVVARYAHGGDAAITVPVDAVRYGPSYARLLRHHPIACAKAPWGLPRLAAACRRAFRPRFADPEDAHNAFVLARVDVADRARLEARAAAWGVTAHDVLLALLLQALAPLTQERLRSPKRDEIAIATIVNIRRELGADAEHAFAPYLASFRVAHRVPDTVSPRELALAMHAQTGAITSGKRYLQTLPAMGIANAEWRFLSPRQQHRFFAKHYPVCAGTTPLNVDRLWASGGASGPGPDYVRGVATGPLAPMVVAFTMAGGAINIGVAFRRTVYARAAVEGIAAAMMDAIRTL